MDLSILIVHTFEANLVRQTLRGIRRAAPRLRYEVLLMDNNPEAGLQGRLHNHFPEVRYIPMDANRGFGYAMNAGFRAAKGKYILVFNPDIIVHAGGLEALFAYMESHPDVGTVGPKLINPDGTLQHSCYRYHTPMIPAYRRTPLGRLPMGKRALANFLMHDFAHDVEQEVDWIMGSAMFTRRAALDDVGHFDDAIFMYLEDTDLCRRMWEKGWRVIYNPEVRMVHYLRRASNDGSLITQLLSPMTRHHIRSAVHYFRKYLGKPNPRTDVARLSRPADTA